MLSFGTELDLAFWIASARVGLPAGSPPPVRAATSTFLISLANSLPRRASTTAFLCFVVAHLLCPLMCGRSCRLLLDHRDEQRLRLCGARRALVPRRADENAVHRTALDAVDVEIALPRIDLPAERVAPHGH